MAVQLLDNWLIYTVQVQATRIAKLKLVAGKTHCRFVLKYCADSL